MEAKLSESKKSTPVSRYTVDLIFPALRSAEVIGVGPFVRSPVDPRKEYDCYFPRIPLTVRMHKYDKI